MDWNSQTVKVYDDAAEAFAGYFKAIGSRVSDIELGLSLAQADESARVVEIGCGDGRDAEEICKRVAWYEGYDPSEKFLEIARKRLPEASFVQADALTYQYPTDLDVIYAFASLLHVNQADMKTTLIKAAKSLRTNGILYVSLKERASYQEEVKEDLHGKRMFYYYNPAVLKEIAGEAFTVVYEDHHIIGHTEWFVMALRKN